MYKFSTRKEHDAFYAKQLERERLIARANKLAPLVGIMPKVQIYRAIDFEAVPDFINAAARAMLDYCSAKFNGLDIAVAWCERVESGKCERPVLIDEHPTAGWQSNSLLWVRCDMPFEEVLFTIAHEAHHRWYGRGPGRKHPYKAHAEQWEASADAFARLAVSKIVEYRAAHDDICALRGLSAALSGTRQRMPARRKQSLS
jgi:hypothetical protein